MITALALFPSVESHAGVMLIWKATLDAPFMGAGAASWGRMQIQRLLPAVTLFPNYKKVVLKTAE
jgi:hypothetical protein